MILFWVLIFTSTFQTITTGNEESTSYLRSILDLQKKDDPRSSISNTKICNGIVIRETAVITAASCVAKLKHAKFLVHSKGGKKKKSAVISDMPHPMFNHSKQGTFDLAVLQLEHRIHTNNTVGGPPELTLADTRPKKNTAAYISNCLGRGMRVTTIRDRESRLQNGGEDLPSDVFCAKAPRPKKKGKLCLPATGSPLVIGRTLIGVYYKGQKGKGALKEFNILFVTSVADHKGWLGDIVAGFIQSVDAGIKPTYTGKEVEYKNKNKLRRVEIYGSHLSGTRNSSRRIENTTISGVVNNDSGKDQDDEDFGQKSHNNPESEQLPIKNQDSKKFDCKEDQKVKTVATDKYQSDLESEEIKSDVSEIHANQTVQKSSLQGIEENENDDTWLISDKNEYEVFHKEENVNDKDRPSAKNDTRRQEELEVPEEAGGDKNLENDDKEKEIQDINNSPEETEAYEKVTSDDGKEKGEDANLETTPEYEEDSKTNTDHPSPFAVEVLEKYGLGVIADDEENIRAVIEEGLYFPATRRKKFLHKQPRTETSKSRNRSIQEIDDTNANVTEEFEANRNNVTDAPGKFTTKNAFAGNSYSEEEKTSKTTQTTPRQIFLMKSSKGIIRHNADGNSFTLRGRKTTIAKKSSDSRRGEEKNQNGAEVLKFLNKMKNHSKRYEYHQLRKWARYTGL